MRKLISGLFATGLAVATAFTGVMPAGAAPRVQQPLTVDGGVPVVQVQMTQRERRKYRRAERRINRIERRQDRRLAKAWERRNGNYYYHGYRGYRDRRAGYRYYNGYYFPAAAFLAGAIVGGAITNGNRGGGNHVDWCQSRYRSYRVSDNTYQPNSGPRRQCNSPYN